MDSELKSQSWIRSTKKLPMDLSHAQRINGGDQVYMLDISMSNLAQLNAVEKALNLKGLTIAYDPKEFGSHTAHAVYMSEGLKLYTTRHTLETHLGAVPGIAMSNGRMYGAGKDTVLETRIDLTGR